MSVNFYETRNNTKVAARFGKIWLAVNSHTCSRSDRTRTERELSDKHKLFRCSADPLAV